MLALIDATGVAARAGIAAARDHAGVLASFDPGPEAARARRYEADAERGFYRALRTLDQLRADRPAAKASARAPLPPPPAVAPEPAAPPPAPDEEPTPPVGSCRAGAVAPGSARELGSFRLDRPTLPAEPAPTREERRKRRPDLRKLAKNRR